MYLSALSTVLYVTTSCCETVCGPWKCQSRKSVLWLVYRWMGVTYVFCLYLPVCTHACNGRGSVIKSYLQLFVFYYQMRCLRASRTRSREGLLHSRHCSGFLTTWHIYTCHQIKSFRSFFRSSLAGLFISVIVIPVRRTYWGSSSKKKKRLYSYVFHVSHPSCTYTCSVFD